MVYKIKLSGVIASDMEASWFGDEGLITLKQVETELKNAGGQDIEVDLSSVGGLVSAGVDIYFALRDYKRQNPTAQMQLNMKSQIASMASHIASGEFWDLITAEDITSWMIHNPSMYVEGDYRIMKDASEYLERLSALYAGSYIKRSKKSEKEVRSMMDKTTYLFGEEIVKAGFADEILPTAEEKNKPAMISKIELKYKSIMKKISQHEGTENDYLKAVAKMQDEITTQKPAESGKNNQEEIKMNFDEVKTTFSSELAGIEMAGKDKGKVEMVANNKAIMELKAKEEFKNLPFIQERCDKALMEGEKIEDLKMSINAMLLDPKNAASLESPGNINTGGQGTMSGEHSNDKDKSEVKW